METEEITTIPDAQEHETTEEVSTEQEGTTEQEKQTTTDPVLFDPDRHVDLDRFNKIYGRMKHLEREIEARDRTKPEPRTEAPYRAPQQDPTDPRPDRGTFDDEDDYIVALGAWGARQESRKTFRELEESRTKQQQHQTRDEFINSILAKGTAKDPKFQEKAYLPEQLMPIVMEVSENPVELALHWGKNPDVTIDLARLSPAQIAKEIVKTEAQLTKSQRPPPRTTTGAPNPIPTVGTGGTAERSISDMSAEEWAAYKNRKEGKAVF